MGRRMVAFWNFLTHVRRKRCAPERLLFLVPSCLQNSDCKQNIAHDITQCQRCGRCKVADVLALAERLGARAAVATGGRLALQMAKDKAVDGVIAVACVKELTEGMRALFPKAVLGVVNMQPHGPCKDTDVDMAAVKAAVERLTGQSIPDD